MWDGTLRLGNAADLRVCRAIQRLRAAGLSVYPPPSRSSKYVKIYQHSLVDLVTFGTQVVKGAEESQETMPDQPLTDERLRDHALKQAGAGDIVGARQTVSRMIDRQYLREAWIAILYHQMRLGDLQGVKETIVSFPDDSLWHSHTTFYFPLDYAKAGDVPGAIEIANKMRGRILALGMIALVQAQRGDFAGARETASLIDDERFRSDILDFVSELQSEGKIPEESDQH